MVVIQGRLLTKIDAQFCNFGNGRKDRNDEDASDATRSSHALPRAGSGSLGDLAASGADGYLYGVHGNDGSYRDDDNALDGGEYHGHGNHEPGERRA
jgi:hypothetical protein